MTYVQTAFDSITHEHIKATLLKHGCHPDVVSWYYKLLIHRNLKKANENLEHEITTNLGFPQGGVCNTKFWKIAFDEAAKILNSNGFFC